MNFPKWIPAAAVVAALCLSSCSATKRRINDNEELFNSYSPAIQASIKSNRIQRGFDSTQVWMALGNADRTESRADGETWFYHRQHSQTITEEKSASEYRLEMSDYEKAKAEGKTVAEPSTHRSYKLYRTAVWRMVHFEGGVVTSWEEPDDMWIEDWHR